MIQQAVDPYGIIQQGVDSYGMVQQAVDSYDMIQQTVDSHGMIQQAVDSYGMIQQVVDPCCMIQQAVDSYNCYEIDAMGHTVKIHRKYKLQKDSGYVSSQTLWPLVTRTTVAGISFRHNDNSWMIMPIPVVNSDHLLTNHTSNALKFSLRVLCEGTDSSGAGHVCGVTDDL